MELERDKCVLSSRWGKEEGARAHTRVHPTVGGVVPTRHSTLWDLHYLLLLHHITLTSLSLHPSLLPHLQDPLPFPPSLPPLLSSLWYTNSTTAGSELLHPRLASHQLSLSAILSSYPLFSSLFLSQFRRKHNRHWQMLNPRSTPYPSLSVWLSPFALLSGLLVKICATAIDTDVECCLQDPILSPPFSLSLSLVCTCAESVPSSCWV